MVTWIVFRVTGEGTLGAAVVHKGDVGLLWGVDYVLPFTNTMGPWSRALQRRFLVWKFSRQSYRGPSSTQRPTPGQRT